MGGHVPLSRASSCGTELVQGPREIGGQLTQEVRADRQLASEQKMGRELGPWAERQDRQEERRELVESEKGSGSGNTGQRLPHMGPITRTGGQVL